MCQRAFGNIFATFFTVKRDDVTWDSAEPSYYASSKIARRGFCPRCGTPLTFQYHDADTIDLAAGSLDEPGEMKPMMHVGVEGRIAAFAVDDGLPSKRIDEFPEIMARWRAAGEG
jgi:hypothetical protein